MANQDDPFGINELFSGSNLPAVVNTYKPIDPMAEMAALVKERNAMDVLRSKQVEAQNRAAFDNELADKAMNFDVYKEKAIANIENKTGVKLIGKARTEFARKKIQANVVKQNVSMMEKNSFIVGKYLPFATMSRFLRLLLLSTEGMMNKAFRSPQIMKVQFAPCQKPVNKKMMHKLR